MIIKCDNCNKNFDVDSGLIPENGRLLQCNACDHKWFFKKEIKERSIPIVKIKDIDGEPEPLKEEATRVETETQETIDLLDRVTEDVPVIEKISIKNNNETEEISREDKTLNTKTSKNKKNYNILSLTIVFIISFIAIIIVLDTFQKPISLYVPNIEFILYNLYETINDIVLFFRDLI
jgi:predicted Zn finger-like uncharacterized protein